MIAKVYYAVGVVQVVGTIETSGYSFPLRIFDRDELPQAEREYTRLAKRNYSDDLGYGEAYLIKMLGEDKEILKGNYDLISPWI